jgi:hypothetical protein
MKHLIQDFLSDILSQLFGYQKPRDGKLRLTHNALNRMHEHQLDEATLEDTFRHGEQVKEKMIVRKYDNYSVGLIFYKPIDENRFVIITCWKN